MSVAVKAYTATNSANATISFNQLHKECNTKINQKKVCPIHGELKSDDIVSGYEFAEGQYVVVDTSELEKLRTAKDRSIDIKAFIARDAIDPAYFSDKTYYLVPDGPMGFKPYALLHRIMVEQKRNGFAQVVFTGKEQVVLLRPIGGLLAMTPLSYAADLRTRPSLRRVPKIDISPEELTLAKTLTDAMSTDEFDLSVPRSVHGATQKLIEAKIAGQDIVTANVEEAPMVTNLMEALQKSVAKAAKTAKPPKLVATTAEVVKGKTRRKKSS